MNFVTMVDNSLDDLLKKLLGAIPELKNAANMPCKVLFSETTLPKGLSKERIVTMVAGMFSLSERLIIEMRIGEIDQLCIKGSKGYLMIIPDDPNIVLKISKTRYDREDNHNNKYDENSGLGAGLVNSY